MKDFLLDLKWRGMVHDISHGTEAQLTKEMTVGYIGFEPTAPSLHIGNLVPIMMLKYLQQAGHKPIVVVGGATAMIGDPSGKTTERKMLSEETIYHNQACISKQLKQFLDFNDKDNSAEIVNNIEWFKCYGFLSFLREVGKYMPIGYMMAKESVKSRLEIGISFTEFTYQLLQGYDFYHLYTTKNVKLQMGGSDQWGNLTTGVELIRKKVQGDAFVITTPLLTQADGTKFGKTAGGVNIWLDASLTSPYEFYQFFLNRSDDEASKLVKIFTLLKQEEVVELIQMHQMQPEKRLLQQVLAEKVTKMVHSDQDCKKSIAVSHILFNATTTQRDLEILNEQCFQIIVDHIPNITINKVVLEHIQTVIELISVSTRGLITSSKGEARQLIQGGGLRINKILITDPYASLPCTLLHNKYLLIQKGKKQHYCVVVR